MFEVINKWKALHFYSCCKLFDFRFATKQVDYTAPVFHVHIDVDPNSECLVKLNRRDNVYILRCP